MQVGIFGVGRSGTTALYAGVQNLIQANGISCHYLYEPYLWSHLAFDGNFDQVKSNFSSTSSLSLEGMYAHHVTPLFTHESNPTHDHYLSLITENYQHFLIKAIRGNGRLSLFLERFPEFRVVFVVRNPLDVINSVVNRFSFFGDEFHPSDKPRFLEELKQEFINPEELSKQRNEVEWSLLWWRYMNQAALKTISNYRDRVLVVAYEAFKANPNHTFHKIGQFLELDTQALAIYEATRPVGPISEQVNLDLESVNFIKQQDEEYWQDYICSSDIYLDQNIDSLREQVYQRYQEALSGPIAAKSMTIAPDSNPLLVRNKLFILEQQRKELLIKEKIQQVPSLDMGFSLAEGDYEDWEHTRFVAKQLSPS
jgi:hypothetical protein